ncbi:uncharacterized protein LOC132189036 [Corylus avellana]|uniref:uncharacterized protein LOC132168594 n=1 Tax=Corylus avellana TaxID=13451 RepID=UPI00286A7F13|nr:uncharacterized protein LOC132168594 [Corylus avellana]XP_059444157.1 uncharacterized protein LOC132176060 [Corylus avellana]XP_059445131.1 uncharacterized protein LOC132176972 [Corylus avellana]XP_059459493.1 uncharacterized protein LOC132189036 [Corylus avellana]
MQELTTSEALEEGNVEGTSVDDRMQEIVTQVLGGRRAGHVRGMGCGLIPTPLRTSSQAFTHFDNHDECRKRQEDTQSELQQTRIELHQYRENLQANVEETNKLKATVEFLMSRIGGSGGSLLGGASSEANN